MSDRDYSNNRGQRWTKREDDLLRQLSGVMTEEELAERLLRTKAAVKSRKNFLGVRIFRSPKKKWSSDESRYVVQHYRDKGAGQIASDLARTRNSVIGRYHRMVTTAICNGSSR